MTEEDIKTQEAFAERFGLSNQQQVSSIYSYFHTDDTTRNQNRTKAFATYPYLLNLLIKDGKIPANIEIAIDNAKSCIDELIEFSGLTKLMLDVYPPLYNCQGARSEKYKAIEEDVTKLLKEKVLAKNQLPLLERTVS